MSSCAALYQLRQSTDYISLYPCMRSPTSFTQRHYYMKDVNIFVAEPGNTKAILAVSALGRAMKEMNKVAIVRCVWRQGQGSVVVGILTPNVSDNEKIVSRPSKCTFFPPSTFPFRKLVVSYY